MTPRADVAVYDRDARRQLLVEVKSRTGASPEWASQYRRNLLVHSIIPSTPYFLLALPDTFFLWKSDGATGNEAPPSYSVNASKVFAHYLDTRDISVEEISENGLELLVLSWLHDMVNSDPSRENIDQDTRWVIDSGLHEAIKDGSIAVEALA